MARTLREKHAEATRRALLRAARTLFAKRGYDATGVDEIAAHAGATRGAVYHHFKGKRELLLTVLDEMQAALAQRVVEASLRETDPALRMRAAIATFLDACTEPAHAKILLEDAPAALGWDTWREVDDRHFRAITRAGIEQLIASGHAPPVDPDVLADLFLGALTEAALRLARDRTPETRARIDTALDVLLRGALESRGAAQ
jgi:AcrR family transcriptional regulator